MGARARSRARGPSSPPSGSGGPTARTVRLELAFAPQAVARSRGLHVVGTLGPGLVDRRAVRRGISLLRARLLCPLADTVGATTDDITYFIGSIFFTSAAFLQYREAVGAAGGPGRRGRTSSPSSWRVLGWAPWRIDWWATSVQFVGTLFFNSSPPSVASTSPWRSVGCGRPTRSVRSASSWPAHLAWAEVGHAWWSWRPSRIGWRDRRVNLVGSLAFGVSAVAAYIVRDTGELRNTALANAGTFVGAVCFFAGGLLLLPERTMPPGYDRARLTSRVGRIGRESDRQTPASRASPAPETNAPAATRAPPGRGAGRDRPGRRWRGGPR